MHTHVWARRTRWRGACAAHGNIQFSSSMFQSALSAKRLFMLDINELDASAASGADWSPPKDSDKISRPVRFVDLSHNCYHHDITVQRSSEIAMAVVTSCASPVDTIVNQDAICFKFQWPAGRSSFGAQRGLTSKSRHSHLMHIACWKQSISHCPFARARCPAAAERRVVSTVSGRQHARRRPRASRNLQLCVADQFFVLTSYKVRRAVLTIAEDAQVVDRRPIICISSR
jgi:hypothetical protein